MVMQKKFNSLSDLTAMQKLATQADEPVYLASGDGSIRVDARSFISLFTLDFSKPVQVITDSLYVIRRLEIEQRHQEAALAAVR